MSAGPEFLAFPLDVAGNGQLRTAGEDDHLRDLVLQVLLTEPGERVNLPEFGCGISRLVFAGNSDVLQATTQFLIQQNLVRWLGDQLELEAAEVTPVPDEGRVEITVRYMARRSRTPQEVSVRV
jgi:phage baseplate assembly protein W